MSDFTDNLYLRREIQRLLNENNQMKSLLSEYRGPYDTGENIGGFDFRTPEEKAEQEEADNQRKEAAKKITTDELQRMAKDAGFTGTPEEFSKQIRKERFAIRQKAKDAAAAGARSAEDFQKAVENKTYKLTAGQQKMYDKEGTAYLERLSRGLSRREAERLRSSAKVTDQADLARLKATKDVPFIGSRSDAEDILARRRQELDKYGGGPLPYENDYFAARDKSWQISGAAAARFRAGQDETTRRNREEALRTSTGQKVRDFNALVSGQQAQIKQFGQQMRRFRPETRQRILDDMERGMTTLEALRNEQERENARDVQRIEDLKAKEKRLSDMEAAYRKKYPGRDMSDQAIQGRISAASPETVAAAKARLDARNALTPDQQKRASSAEERRKHIEDIRAGRI